MKASHHSELRAILRKASSGTLSAILVRRIRRRTSEIFRRRPYTPFHDNQSTPVLPLKELPDNPSEYSLTSEQRRAQNPFCVFLDYLRHIGYLRVKAPVELSREVRSNHDEVGVPILVTSSHDAEYMPRMVHSEPDEGYIRLRMCYWDDGHIKMLDLYDDIPVYCGGRLPHGRVHFDMSRGLWKLPNIGIVDNETYVTYEIREPYSIIYDELKPFLLHDESSCLLVMDTPSPGLIRVRLTRLYCKRKIREWTASLRRLSKKSQDYIKYSCLGSTPPDFKPWLL